MIMDRNGRVQNSNRGGFQEEDEKAVKDGKQNAPGTTDPLAPECF